MENPRHELIQSNYGLPFKTFTFRGIDSDKIIPLHWHNHIELLFCISGSLSVVISGKSYLLNKNEMILINTNMIHSSYSPTVNHVLCIQFPLEWLRTQIGHDYGKSWLIELNNSNKNVTKDTALLAKLQTITELTAHQQLNISEKLDLHAQIFLLLELLMRYSMNIKQSTQEISDFELGRNMINYINDHFQEDLTLQDASNHFSYSNEYCSRHFKKILGTNFKELLTSTRLNYAYDKIITTTDNLESIALESGFSTYRNMYNSFVHSYHTSPSNLRDSNKLHSV